MTDADIPVIIGEYSLNTGFAGDPKFWKEYLAEQLSVWANTPGVLGSFFWNHRILPDRRGWFKEFSFLGLLEHQGWIPPAAEMDLSRVCPGQDLSRCPKFD